MLLSVGGALSQEMGVGVSWTEPAGSLRRCLGLDMFEQEVGPRGLEHGECSTGIGARSKIRDAAVLAEIEVPKVDPRRRRLLQKLEVRHQI